MEDSAELAVVASCFPPVVEEQIRAVVSDLGAMDPSVSSRWTWAHAPPATAAHSCASPFGALLLSPTGTGHADQEGKHLPAAFFHLMSGQVAGGPVKRERGASVPRPASSSSVVVYLLNANHKARGAYPGKNQLRTVIFMEITKQAISEWIYSRLGGNPSAAGGTHPPLPAGRGGEAAAPLLGARRGCCHPRSTFPPSCPQAASPSLPPRVTPSPREARQRFTEGRLASRAELRRWFPLARGKPRPGFPPCSVFLRVRAPRSVHVTMSCL